MTTHIFDNDDMVQFRKLIETHAHGNNKIVFTTRFLTKSTVWSRVDPIYHRFIFAEDEMNYNPDENVMVPPHKVVSPENHPDMDIYPTILTYDPMVRRLKAKIGDIIEIQRPSGVYYRVVRKQNF